MAKMSFNLPDEAVTALRDLAQERGTTVTDVVRSAISNEMYLTRQVVDEGAKLLIESRDNRIREVVLPEMRRLTPVPSEESR